MERDPNNPQETQQDPAPDPSPSPSPTSTNDPPVSPTNERVISPKYLELLEQQLKTQHQELERLRTQPAPAPTPPPPPAPRNIEEERQRYFDDPRGETEGLVRSVIREELKASIAPLQEFVTGFRGQTQRERLIAKYQADPRYAKYMNNPRFMQYVNGILDSIKGEIQEHQVSNTIVSVIGAVSVGEIDDVKFDAAPAPNGGDPAPQPTTGQPVIPAHHRPSAPPRPGGPAPTTKPVLTELEKRMMKEGGFKTEEEFVKWRDMPASEVASADFDKPPAPAK